MPSKLLNFHKIYTTNTTDIQLVLFHVHTYICTDFKEVDDLGLWGNYSIPIDNPTKKMEN